MRVKHQVRNLKYMYIKQETLQVFMFMHVQKQKTKCILVKHICSKADQSDHLCQANAFVHTGNYLNHYHGYFSIGQFCTLRKQSTFPEAAPLVCLTYVVDIPYLKERKEQISFHHTVMAALQ